MSASPTRWNRLAARWRREIPATGLDAYRRASLAVFELFEQAEQRRDQHRAVGTEAWAVPAAERTELVCAWNAFVLQVLGNCLLDADYQGDPATRGFVPHGTAEQILAFYGEVEGWMVRAHQARANPGFAIDRPLPAPLPRWSDDPQRSASHVPGLRHAMRAVRGHAEAAMAYLPDGSADHPRKQAQLDRIRQALEAAQARARHAEELCGAGPRPSSHAFAEAYLRDAVERFWLLGQAIADPPLADRPELAAHRPVDLGAGAGRAVITQSPPRRRGRLSATERAHLETASDPRQPFPRRHDAVLEACRGRAPVAEVLALYDWLDVPALREMLVFGLQARPEAEALEAVARMAREDADPQVRHAARFWLRLSRHRDAPRLRAALGLA